MKKISLVTLFGALAALPMAVAAQNLDTTLVVDQFSTGSRSSQPNGSAYTGADITGPINYYTTFEGGTATETEVLDVTVPQAHDGGGPTPAFPGNTGDSFSTSPNFAIYIGDFGGGQNLMFGTEASSNYFIRAAAYCEPRTVAGTPPQFERTYIAARVPALVGTTFNTASNTDAIGGYALMFESDTATFIAAKIHPDRATADLTGAQANGKDAVARTTFAESAPISAAAWHVLEINCYNSLITFKVNGTILAQVTDTKYTNGLASLSYREVFTPTAPNEYQGRFDYVVAGPAEAPLSANAWDLYE